jgi:ATP-dependent DNA helicase RecG
MAAKKTKKPQKLSVKADSSTRTVGPLSIFGFNQLWRVPAIIPKEYLDYSKLVVDFAKLVDGQLACVGGRASECNEIKPVVLQEEAAHPQDADASADADGLGEIDADCELSDKNDVAEVDDGEVQEEIDDFESSETDDNGKAQAIKTWTFKLIGESRSRPLTIEMNGSTRAQQSVIEKAKAGGVVYLYGKVVKDGAGLSLIDVEPVELGDIGTIHARYPSKSRKEFLKQITKTRNGVKRPRQKPKTVTRTITSDNVAIRIRERLDGSIKKAGEVVRERLGIENGPQEWELLRKFQSPTLVIEGLFRQAHEPRSIAEGMQALDALRKLAALDVLKEIEKTKRAARNADSRVRCTKVAYAAAIASLKTYGKLTLTSEQEMAVWEICYDLDSNHRMHRILSGDVGTGKTLVFGVVAAMVCAEQKLVVILEPRTQLSEQVFAKIRKYWPHIQTELINRNTGDVIIPKSGILVGTTGIWNRLEAAGISPSLIVCDEQQKFGTGQRQPWLHTAANMLEATATPIPRTQALLEFGGVDVSRLQFCHVEKNIETILVRGEFELESAYEDVIENIKKKGMNLILVFPEIFEREVEEGQDDGSGIGSPPKAVMEAYAHWSSLFPGRVALIHGQLDSEVNSRALAQFEAGEVDVIMGTSILEVGIDFTKARQMIIHHPESLGVSAVHQLRGRLARQGGRGWCYLAIKPIGAHVEMMEMMTVEKDGLKLATLDLIRRGTGDMRQHAKQQSGVFSGFLVGSKPEIEDFNFVSEQCQKWIKEEAVPSDLIGTDERTTTFMTKLAKEPRKAVVVEPPIKGNDLPAEYEQAGLF